MGLSNEERFERVIWSVKRLNDLLPTLERYKGYSQNAKNIPVLIRDLWATLLSNQGDGMFWIMGSSMTNPHLDVKNLFHAAMIAHGETIAYEVNTLVRKKEDKEDLEAHAKQDPKFSMKEHEEYESDTKYGKDCLPNIIQIIHDGDDGAFNSAILKIYAELENCMYAINRYDDEFAKEFTPMRKLIANLNGECFAYMSIEKVFFEAYLLDAILKKLLSKEWDSKKNLIFNIFKTFYCHHHCKVKNRDDFQIAELMVIWKKIQNAEKISDNDRICIWLEIAGHNFAEAEGYNRNELMKILTKFNKNVTSSNRVSVARVNSILNKLGKEIKRNENERQKTYNEDHNYCGLMDHFEETTESIKSAREYKNKKK